MIRVCCFILIVFWSSDVISKLVRDFVRFNLFEFNISEEISNRSRDSLALVALYESTNGPNWTTTWNLAQPIDTWFGVSLNQDGCVTCLNFENLDSETNCDPYGSSGSTFIGLEGQLPNEFWNLSDLEYLNFNNERISGEISERIGNLVNLQYLNLSGNRFTGGLPETLFSLNKLKGLRVIGNNNLGGNISPDIQNLSELEDLALINSGFNGIILEYITGLTNLEFIQLGNNNFEGNIPPAIQNLTNLSYIYAQENNFSGSIPGELGNLTQIANVDFSKNNLTGNIPIELAQLETFFVKNFDDNNLSGCFPNEFQIRCVDDNFSFSNNPKLPWQGDLEKFCNGEIQIGASCQLDGKIGIISENCECLIQSDCSGENHPDFEALIALYNSTDGANWTNNDGWKEGVAGESCDPCDFNGDSWFGLECENQRVVNIEISENNLSGSLPDNIGSLSQVRKLNFDRNDLTNIIPNSIYELVQLEIFNIQSNDLSGEISTDIGNLSNLRSINANNNSLSGNIPINFWELDKLQGIQFNGNNLTGTIPSEIGNLTQLSTLVLRGNSFSGELPEDLEKCINLEDLLIGDNDFSGDFPDLSVLRNFQRFIIQNNQFTGDIPSYILLNSNLSEFFIDDNDFEGCYSNDLENLCDNFTFENGNPMPSTYNMSSNPRLPWRGDFSRYCDGEEQIGARCRLNAEEALINENCQCAAISLDCSGVNHPDYEALIALYNSTDGPNWTNNDGWKEGAAGESCDPCDYLGSTWFGIECENNRVTCLDMSGLQSCNTVGSGGGGNNLNGTIPIELMSLSNLKKFRLKENFLSGEIPFAISQLSDLEIIDFDDNQLSGSIPSSLGSLSSLTYLNLDDNQLTGSIPIDFGNLSQLEELWLQVNNLDGNIPKEIGNLSKLKTLSISNNDLEGEIPSEFWNLLNLENLNLNGNNLSGALASEIGNLLKLEYLSLNDNRFSGELPNELGDLQELYSLSLRNNFFSGCFPSSYSIFCDFDENNFPNDFSGNPSLSWEGDFDRFCEGEEQVGATCVIGPDDAIINENCECVNENQNNNACRTQDSLELVKLYERTGGENWDYDIEGYVNIETLEGIPMPNLGNPWNFNEPISTWHGVELNEDGCVSKLFLGKSSFAGPFPDLDLTQLEVLHFNTVSAQTNGALPTFESMVNLRELIFIDTDFWGAIPSWELPILENLVMDLDNNPLDGPLDFLENSPLIKFVFISGQDLAGNLPNFNLLGDLEYFDVSDNQLEGSIPNMDNATSLKYFNVSKNKLSGPPPNLSSLENLELFYVTQNDLEGCVVLSDNLCAAGIGFPADNLYDYDPGYNFDDNNALANEGTGTIFCDLSIDEQIGQECVTIAEGDEGVIGQNCECIIENCTEENHPDYGALIALYNSTNGANWTNNDGWKEGSVGESCNPCDLNGVTWHGIQCENNRVTHISLDEDPRFEISSIGRDDKGNNVIGELPDEFIELTKLKLLDLNGNELEGTIFDKLNTPELEALDVGFHRSGQDVKGQLTGELPNSINQYDNLKALSIYNNCFSGQVPSELGEVQSLELAYLMDNKFTGAIPNSLGNLSNITQLGLSDNMLSGCFPESLQNICGINFLRFRNNPGLSWGGDTARFCNGEDQIGAPCEIDGQEAMISEDCECVNENQNCGDESHPDYNALIALYNSTNGTVWVNNNGWKEGASNESCDPCNFNGEPWFGLRCEENRVTGIDLEANNLTGQLPIEIGNLNNLKSLILYDNSITGAINEAIGELFNLERLNLGSNNWSGQLPKSLVLLQSLRTLIIRETQLSGTLPPELFSLNDIEYIDLSQNKLTGIIPSEVGNAQNLQYLELGNNQLEGSIPLELSNLPSLEFLQLNLNNLSGCYPNELSSICETVSYDFSRNSLLPWEGDFKMFCEGEDQIGAPCQTNGQEALINENCECSNENQNCGNENHPDYDGLIALYTSTDGLNWTNNNGWEEGASGESCDPCNFNGEPWNGITCSEGRVTRIYLSQNNLAGEIPPEIGDLQELDYIHLGFNSISGTIPEEITFLTKLEQISLFSNNIQGQIPDSIGDLRNLKILELMSNQLQGSIPTSISNLRNLENLGLFNNNLSGTLPQDIGNLSELKYFAVSGNELSGPIPPSIGDLSKLQQIWFHDNDFSGCFPEPLKNLCYLTTESVYVPACENNVFEGCQFDFNNNPSLTWQGDFKRFCTSEDQFRAPCITERGTDGEINQDCECVDENQEEACRSRDSLALVSLYESTNGSNWINTWNLSEPIDTWWGVHLNNDGCVTCLDLDGDMSGIYECSGGIIKTGNGLSGSLPDSFFELKELNVLSLGNNAINGAIPSSIAKLRNLTYLSLSDNDISGSIPNELCSMTNLTALYLSQNELSGVIPSCIGNLDKLLELQMNNNNLEGEIPTSLGNLSRLRASLYLSHNNLTGSIPEELGDLSQCSSISLSDNMLSGEIPLSLGNIQTLRSLNVENNNLKGCIPENLKRLCPNNLYTNNNNLMPWQGDRIRFCSDEESIGAPCEINGQEAVINENCECINDNICSTFQITLDADFSICEGETTTISVMEGEYESYLWSTGETTPTIEVSTSDSYFVNVVNADGCESSDTLFIESIGNVNKYLPNIISVNNDGINDLFILFTNSSDCIDEIDISIFDGGNIVYQNNLSGLDINRSMQIWDGNDGADLCAEAKNYTYEITLQIGEELEEITGSICVYQCGGDSFIENNCFDGDGLLNARWPNQHDGFGGFDPTLMDREPIGQDSCISLDPSCTTLVSEPEIIKVVSPNGDGMNDFFDTDISDLAEEFPDNELQIFNRWGQQVFEIAPYNNNWGGKNQSGQDLPEGTYYFTLRLKASISINIITGAVTVIR